MSDTQVPTFLQVIVKGPPRQRSNVSDALTSLPAISGPNPAIGVMLTVCASVQVVGEVFEVGGVIPLPMSTENLELS